ncbi:hypothetical protein HU200_052676 [Digitaria exilis]|uniref:Uncharacterized protein n=1 Tax=Digitaria exilis TaxID=1010633 RepID=A0A835E8G6_9POAL|nr:hypothetical protein HU200_052676 [Digitaria exilis]
MACREDDKLHIRLRRRRPGRSTKARSDHSWIVLEDRFTRSMQRPCTSSPRTPHSPCITSHTLSGSRSDTHSDSSSSSGVESLAAPATASLLQSVNIRSHVPVLLDIDESKYGQWSCSFVSVLGKFGIADHVTTPPSLEDERDADPIGEVAVAVPVELPIAYNAFFRSG